ncbi:MAG: hypothetical protein JW990_08470 [Thermoleophilia bacterium]|nr:hypothetical protein [Thermoleophilia bacterium]
MVRSATARSRRDAYLGVACAVMAVGYLLGLAADLTYPLLGRPITFSGSTLLGAGWLFLVCGPVLRGVGFAFIAAAFLGRVDARRARFRCGALLLAGGYGLMIVYVVLVTLYYYRNPDLPQLDGFLMGMVMQVVAFLSASVGALLVASAFRGPVDSPAMEAAARNRRLGCASVAFGLMPALLLLADLVTIPTVSGNVTVDAAGGESLAGLAAIAAAIVAAVGFFGAARAHRLFLPDALPRREGVLAIAATLYLAYQAVDLADLRDFASWPSRLAVVAFAGAVLCAVIGFVVSRRSPPRVGLSPRPGPTG